MNLLPYFVVVLGIITAGLVVIALLVASIIMVPKGNRRLALFLLLIAVGGLILFLLFTHLQFVRE